MNLADKQEGACCQNEIHRLSATGEGTVELSLKECMRSAGDSGRKAIPGRIYQPEQFSCQSLRNGGYTLLVA